jgi:L-galactose dehydrogenase
MASRTPSTSRAIPPPSSARDAIHHARQHGLARLGRGTGVRRKARILDGGGNPLPSDAIAANLDMSLRTLQVEHIDVFHLHAVQAKHYDYALNELVPVLLRQKAQGKLKHLGITETPPRDPDQAMLSLALDDPCWEIIMLAFHMMNQGPRKTVLPRTRAQRVGTLLMLVVRNVFSRPAVLQETLQDLAGKGLIPRTLADSDHPLQFLIHEAGASSLTDAAYRFARHEPGADVILFGTGDEEHLRANVESLLKPPLPESDAETVRLLFGELRGVGLVLPDFARAPFR